MEDLHIPTTSYVVYRNNLITALRSMFSLSDILSCDPNAKAFETSWHTNTTLIQLCSDVINDTSAIPGRIYLGQVTCSGLPAGITNGRMMIEVRKGLSSKLLLLTVTSAELAPDTWEQSYYVKHFTGWKTWSPTVEPGPTSEALYLRNGYLGVGSNYTDVIDPSCFREVVTRGTPIPTVSTGGYVWAVYPAVYTPIVGMNLVQIPMRFIQDASIDGVEYKIWRSIETQTGSFNLYFL